MDWQKADIYVGHRGDVRGTYRVTTAPLAQNKPKTNPGFAACRTFQAFRPGMLEPKVEEVDPFAELFIPRIVPPTEFSR